MLLSEEFGIPKREENSYKSNKHNWEDPKYCLEVIDDDPYFIMDIPEQFLTEELCIIAVRACGRLIQYIKNPTEEVCLEAVKEDGAALQWIKNQTEEMCKIAVTFNGHYLRYVNEQTDEICKVALADTGLAIQHVINQTEEMCMLAIKKNAGALAHIHMQTDEIIYYSLTIKPLSLVHVHKQTKEWINLAVSKDIHAVNHIDINVLPIKEWPIKWFESLWNVELRRAFIKERGKEVFTELGGVECIDENNEYMLIHYYVGLDPTDLVAVALVYRCPSSNDIYFTEVDPRINNLDDALKFLNNNLGKEQLAYES